MTSTSSCRSDQHPKPPPEENAQVFNMKNNEDSNNKTSEQTTNDRRVVIPAVAWMSQQKAVFEMYSFLKAQVQQSTLTTNNTPKEYVEKEPKKPAAVVHELDEAARATLSSPAPAGIEDTIAQALDTAIVEILRLWLYEEATAMSRAGVNAKQYARILARRKSPVQYSRPHKAEDDAAAVVAIKKTYVHESRSKHAMNRKRGSGGRFLKKNHPEDEGPNNCFTQRDDDSLLEKKPASKMHKT